MITNIAEFNRLLNIATHYRTLKSGKKIKVTGHRRTYERLKSALQDLRKTGRNINENLYLMNPKTGIVSQKDEGDLVYASVSNILKKGNYKESSLRSLSKRWILHNHPVRPSLSLLDFTTARQVNTNIFAINSTGSIFRGYAKPELTDELVTAIAGDIFYYSHDIKKLIPNTTVDERLFLISHTVNKKLHNNGFVHYRYKLSNVDKKLIDNYSDIIENYMDNDYNKRLLIQEYINAGDMDNPMVKTFIEDYQKYNQYYTQDPNVITRQSLLEKSNNSQNLLDSAKRNVKKRKLRQSLTTIIDETGVRRPLTRYERNRILGNYRQLDLY